MAALTKGDFPAIAPDVYGARINALRTELLAVAEYAAAHPVSGAVLMDWLDASSAQIRTFADLDE